MFNFFKKPKINKYHWFEVKYVYTKNGNKCFDFVSQIGLTELKTTLDRRKLKKIAEPLHKLKNVKKFLNNGRFDIEIMCYLGYFSK